MTPDDAGPHPMPHDDSAGPSPEPLPPTGAPGVSPRDADDELVSAVLDGEAAPDEVARVTSDPVLSARLEELRAVAAAVAAPVTPPSSLGSLVDAALAAADTSGDTSGGTSGGTGRETAADRSSAARPAPVVSLDARRRDRMRTLLAVAAVVVVALLAVPLLRSVGSDDAETAQRFSSVGASINAGGADTESGPSEYAPSDDGAADAGAGTSATESDDSEAAAAEVPTTIAPASPTSRASGDLGDLGAHPDAVSLVDAVRTADRAQFAEGATTDLAGPPAPPSCAALAGALEPPGVVAATGTATLAGRPVTVLVVEPLDPSFGPEVVVASASCTEVLDQQPLVP